MTHLPETKLAAHVVKMLEEKHYKVFQEVPNTIKGQSYPIDIVAILDDRVSCVEVKTGLYQKVYDQAIRNKPYCNRSWIAVLEPKTLTPRHKRILQWIVNHGLGLMYISESGIISVAQSATDSERKDERIIDDALCERQTIGLAAGSAAGKRSKKDEWESVRKLLKDTPHLTASQIGRELMLSKRDRTRFINQAGSLNIDGILHDNTNPAKYYLKETA